MKKVAAEGEEFTRSEALRTKKLLDEEGTMSESKKEELKEKINILRSLTWWQAREDKKEEQEP